MAMFGWFNPEKREQHRKIRLHRKHLAPRSRRFLRNYLSAGEKRKPGYYRVLDQLTRDCRPASVVSSPQMTDREIAQAAADAAMTKVLERLRAKNTSGADDFVTDACATIAIAFHRSAGVYSSEPAMQKLGTAAVHLLTIATSFQSGRALKAIIPSFPVEPEW
jgi:hypothetical protein